MNMSEILIGAPGHKHYGTFFNKLSRKKILQLIVMVVGALLLIAMVVTCCVFSLIRLMINKMITLVTGQFPLQIHNETEVGVAMTQMNHEQLVSIVNTSYDSHGRGSL